VPKEPQLQINDAHRFALTLAVTILCGCGASEEVEPEQGAGLRRGDVGEEVARVNQYLAKRGFLPNPELAEAYPDWIPLVWKSPALESEFDESTEQAVRLLQQRSHVSVTGVVDAATRSLIAAPHCGVPESAQLEGDEKWARFPARWLITTITYAVNKTGAPDKDNGNTMERVVDEAFNTWAARSGFIFQKVTSAENINISWAELKDRQVLGSARSNNDGDRKLTVGITFNSKMLTGWLFANAQPSASQTHFGSVVLHEIGHALGLNHSSAGVPVMFATINAGVKRDTLTVDDLQGIHALSPGHSQIGAPGDSLLRVVAGTNGELWAVGGNVSSTGWQMFKRTTSGDWSEHRFGGAGVHIAFDGSKVWHMNLSGQMYREGASGWDHIDGEASRIAAGAGHVFHLGKAIVRNKREHALYHWNGSDWTQEPGIATELTVVKNTLSGKAELWYTNEAGQVYRQTANSAGSDVTRVLPELRGGACNISSGEDGAIYASQCPWNNGEGSPFFIWNEQNAVDMDGTNSDTPKGEGWVQIPGSARDVTSTLGPGTSLARIYHIGTGGALWVSR
jgi:hypothetical protein